MKHTSLNNIEELKKAFKKCKELKRGIEILIEMPDLPSCEIISNPYENLDKKLEYYLKAYNDNLTLKTFDKIKIIAFGMM